MDTSSQSSPRAVMKSVGSTSQTGGGGGEGVGTQPNSVDREWREAAAAQARLLEDKLLQVSELTARNDDLTVCVCAVAVFVSREFIVSYLGSSSLRL